MDGNYAVGDTVSYSCRDASLVPSPAADRRRTCLETGEWSGRAPECKVEEAAAAPSSPIVINHFH